MFHQMPASKRVLWGWVCFTESESAIWVSARKSAETPNVGRPRRGPDTPCTWQKCPKDSRQPDPQQTPAWAPPKPTLGRKNRVFFSKSYRIVTKKASYQQATKKTSPSVVKQLDTAQGFCKHGVIEIKLVGWDGFYPTWKVIRWDAHPRKLPLQREILLEVEHLPNVRW